MKVILLFANKAAYTKAKAYLEENEVEMKFKTQDDEESFHEKAIVIDKADFKSVGGAKKIGAVSFYDKDASVDKSSDKSSGKPSGKPSDKSSGKSSGKKFVHLFIKDKANKKLYYSRGQWVKGKENATNFSSTFSANERASGLADKSGKIQGSAYSIEDIE